MVQLEYAITFDDAKYKIILTDDEADEFISSNNIDSLSKCEKIFISADVLLEGKQEKLIAEYNIGTYIIPQYYFENEIKYI